MTAVHLVLGVWLGALTGFGLLLWWDLQLCNWFASVLDAFDERARRRRDIENPTAAEGVHAALIDASCKCADCQKWIDLAKWEMELRSGGMS